LIKVHDQHKNEDVDIYIALEQADHQGTGDHRGQPPRIHDSQYRGAPSPSNRFAKNWRETFGAQGAGM